MMLLPLLTLPAGFLAAWGGGGGRYVVENSLAATMGRQHSAKDVNSLGSFMQRPPDEIFGTLKARLPPELLAVDVTGEENAESGLVLTPQRVYIGPRALNIWVQPTLLLWVRSRKKGKLVCDASYVAGEVAKGLQLTHLSVRTTLTWVESAIDHLQGRSIPCPLVSSTLALELDRQADSRWPLLLRLLPASVLENACRRCVDRALEEVQGAVAAALVESYEEWCVTPAPTAPPAAVA